MASNLLKMYVDVELFLVTLVGLILRINDMDLSSDPLPLGLRSLFPDSCGWLCTGTPARSTATCCGSCCC